MLFTPSTLDPQKARLIDLRLLAHLGDAVFHLYERERELLTFATVSGLHQSSVKRANAEAQASLLDILTDRLTEEESDIVRRARNIKTQQRQRRNDQSAYRKSTAFEALIGYLYVTDPDRLKEILALTLPKDAKGTAGA